MSNKIRLIAMAGGTGSGKSTVAFALVDKYPNEIALVHLDDYHKKQEEVPIAHGMTNWDHPDAIDFATLVKDLKTLLSGKSITVMTKNERDNPSYEKVSKLMEDQPLSDKKVRRLPLEIKLKPIIILEGYMSLWHPKVRELLGSSIYLDLDHDTRMTRRTKFMGPLYQEKILIPMHNKYVESTKRYADHIINVSKLTQEQVIQKIEALLCPL